MAAKSIELRTLKDCLQFLEWLSNGGGPKRDVVTEFVQRLLQYFRRMGGHKSSLQREFFKFLENVSLLYKTLSAEVTMRGAYKVTTRDRKHILDALLECTPKLLAALSFMQYHVDTAFTNVGGGDWNSQSTKSGNFRTFLTTGNNILPGGFSPVELKDVQGRTLVEDLKKILNKEEDARHDHYRNVILTTLGKPWNNFNTGNTVLLVNVFCQLVEETRNEGGAFKTELESGLTERKICWEDLKKHCKILKEHIDTLTGAGFSVTGRGVKPTNAANFAKASAAWFRANLPTAAGVLSKMIPQSIRSTAELQSFANDKLYPNGFIFDGSKQRVWPKSHNLNAWTPIFQKFRQLDEMLKRLKAILDGDPCRPPDPPQKPLPGSSSARAAHQLRPSGTSSGTSGAQRSRDGGHPHPGGSSRASGARGIDMVRPVNGEMGSGRGAGAHTGGRQAAGTRSPAGGRRSGSPGTIMAAQSQPSQTQSNPQPQPQQPPQGAAETTKEVLPEKQDPVKAPQKTDTPPKTAGESTPKVVPGQQTASEAKSSKPAATKTEATKTESAKPVATKTEVKSPHDDLAEGSSNKGKKAEGAQDQGKKAEGAQDQGKKAEGAQNQGKKAEGAQNQGKKAEGTPRGSPVSDPSASSAGHSYKGETGPKGMTTTKGDSGPPGSLPSHNQQIVDNLPQSYKAPSPSADTMAQRTKPKCSNGYEYGSFGGRHICFPDAKKLGPISSSYDENVKSAWKNAKEAEALEARKKKEDEVERERQKEIRTNHPLIPASHSNYHMRYPYKTIPYNVWPISSPTTDNGGPMLEGFNIAPVVPLDTGLDGDVEYWVDGIDGTVVPVSPDNVPIGLHDPNLLGIEGEAIQDDTDLIRQRKEADEEWEEAHRMDFLKHIQYDLQDQIMNSNPDAGLVFGNPIKHQPGGIPMTHDPNKLPSLFGNVIQDGEKNIDDHQNNKNVQDAYRTLYEHQQREGGEKLKMQKDLRNVSNAVDEYTKQLQDAAEIDAEYQNLYKAVQDSNFNGQATLDMEEEAVGLTNKKANNLYHDDIVFSNNNLSDISVTGYTLNLPPEIKLDIFKSHERQNPDLTDQDVYGADISETFDIEVRKHIPHNPPIDYNSEYNTQIKNTAYIKRDGLDDFSMRASDRADINIPMAVFPDQSPDDSNPYVCRNPWDVPTLSTSPASTALSPPPATDHLPPPKTVREMLYWFVGFNTYGLIGQIKDCVESILVESNHAAFKFPYPLEVTRDPYQLTASLVTAKLTEACLYAAHVLFRIRYKGSSDAYETFFKDQANYAFYYASDPACLLCQLRDYVYACCHQLEFLKAQCNRDKLSGGWKSYGYGSDIKTSSPLQSFLTDDWGSTFETHPFDPYNLCHKSRIRMGFKKNDLSNDSQTGSTISAILTPSCGGDDPLLTLSSYLNCLTRRTPRTTGELVSYFHHFGNSLHDTFTNKLLSLGESLSTPHPDCPDWDRLGGTDLQAVRGIRGIESLNSISNHNHDKEHPRTLSTLVGCGGDSSNCPPRMSPITYWAYALYSQSFAHTYLSWAVYLPDRLWESLLKLHYDLQKHRGSGKCSSLHLCSTAPPLLYTHGITPPEGGPQQTLTCSDVISKLKDVITGKPIASLMTAMDDFLYGIREPFIFTLVALWSTAFFFIAYTMLYRLDVLRIRSHFMRSRESHVIDVKALLTDGTKMPSLYDIDYFDEDPIGQLVIR